MRRAILIATLLSALIPTAGPLRADDGQRLLSVDHYVKVTSTVPALAGQAAQIYVRERVLTGVALRGAAAPDKVVLFVHGAGTPAEVAFDAPIADYSWMAYLAEAGFDVFAMDTTGYGRSTRPAPMNDPCNLAEGQQAQFVPALLAAPCRPSYPSQVTNIGSDWNDIDAVVEYVRKLRGVQKVSLVAWSLGGPRAGGYAAQHQDKVQRLVLLAPAYNRTSAAAAPTLPAPGAAFNTQSRSEFVANWDRQVGCSDQYDPAVRDAVWTDLLASDPVGATWGTGVRRAPATTTWGWNLAMIGGTRVPTMMIAGAHDKQVPPDRVRAAYDDLGATDKVLVDLACSSHNAQWEKNHRLMFEASRQWLTAGALGEQKSGVVRLGY
ncbi:MAG TPA: alpha/beta fold hydrolase [Vicinamibacterales bacterium]|nr:alpha/beta fold hydrolase [Vicinamibacterales bacterium]